jgi:CubicO group peptidase (beta-lactamase class C family)
MMKKNIFLFSLIFIFNVIAFAQNPGENWMRFKTPEQAGWSSEQLEKVCRNSNANSIVLVYQGKIVYTYGDYCRRIKCHSMRKSFLSALYGIYIDKGMIDTAETIGSLNITDITPLTSNEKEAQVIDLLKARSGIYLPSGQESIDAKKSRPFRGSHQHGTFWYYNNWDFNVLGTIFRRKTNKDIFDAFKEHIADPLQMEDFRLMDGVYDFDTLYISHPGYVFKISARDAARFGELYLQNGRWNGEQIIPQKWIEQSTTSYSATTTPGISYGYLWWITEDFNGFRIYYASGIRGQRICVIPSSGIVIVVNVHTYYGRYLSTENTLIARLVIESRTGGAISNPEFVPLKESPKVHTIELSREERHRYVGRYSVGDTTLTVSETAGGLIVEGIHYYYKFSLLPIGKNRFFIEDINLELMFDIDGSGKPINPKIKEPAGG